jgi:cellulose 1,4-beta-cellobiosidase
MKIAQTIAYLAATTASLTAAQQVGTSTPEVHPSLPSQTCTTSGGCRTEQTKIVLDANWRWLHNVGGYTNCYTGNQWDKSLCPDPVTCAKGCALDGADYSGTYGINANNGGVSIRLITRGPYSTNVGSRVYLMQDDTKYKMFKLLNQEFTFDVDVSQLPCGLNGALYFVQMDQDGGMSKYPNNKAGAAYGTGYCDAQCPHDIKFINGEANVNNWTPSKTDPNGGTGQYGTCCAEMDIWESNQISTAFTPHPCTVNGQSRCSGTECGDDATGNRYKGVCDKDGCDWNSYRMNNKTFYGPGSQFAVDSTKPITVVTQFITSDKTANGDLVEIKRFYKQNGKTIQMPNANWPGIDKVNSITDKMCGQAKTLFGDTNDYAVKGGLRAMGNALKRGVVLTMSLWTDHAAQCLWLDSSYPVNKDPSIPGVARGSCPTTSGKPSEVEAQYPGATVKYSNIRVGDIGSTTK